MTTPTSRVRGVALEVKRVQGELLVRLTGSLDADAVASIWDELLDEVRRESPESIRIAAEGVDYLDGAGVGLLAELGRLQGERSGRIEVDGLRPELSELLGAYSLTGVGTGERPRQPTNSAEIVGRQTVELGSGLLEATAFLGEVSVALVAGLARPRSVRWKDALVAAERSGVNALPIVTLVGFLVGLIIAYQSSAQLVDYGGDDLLGGMVSVTMVRELGPLMAAIILAARSGSAYAAEIGTMRVNEEIDALTTMGLDPVRFLAVPRMIAGMVMTPLLTMFSILGGIVGGAVVAVGQLRQTAPFFVEKALDWTDLSDLFGGLFKAVVFGLVIAAVGCHRGLQTRGSASGVGDAATGAVVSGIVSIILLDGAFAVVYFTLGI